MNSTERLLACADDIFEGAVGDSHFVFDGAHISLLGRTNGCTFFDGCLRIFGLNSRSPVTSIDKWNDPSLWKISYPPHTCVGIFFAETAFGDQFFYVGSQVFVMLAETAHIRLVSESFANWIEAILDEPNSMLDLDIYEGWCNSAGQSASYEKHVAPTIPFALGGVIHGAADASIVDAVDDMRFKGQLATQLSMIRPGTKLDIRAINLP